MIKIGITGGIGSGKSMVAALLEVWGIPVYIADTESKHLTATSPVIREKLITLFGKELYTADGLDKKTARFPYFRKPGTAWTSERDHSPRSEPSFFCLGRKTEYPGMRHRISHSFRIGL